MSEKNKIHFDHEVPQSHATADQPTALWGRNTEDKQAHDFKR